MKKNLKQEIRAAARELFGQKGYNNVSMRNIADRLGISVGNLTYHYKKKEELIEAVILEQHKSYQAPEVPGSLMELNELFKRITSHQMKNAYYFRHYSQLAQVSPKVYEVQVKVIKNRDHILKEAFHKLVQNGILQDAKFRLQMEGVIQALHMVNTYWMPQSDLMPNANLTQGPMACLWSIIYPMLTDKGKTIFEEVIAEQLYGVKEEEQNE